MVEYVAENFSSEKLATEIADTNAHFLLLENKSGLVGYVKLQQGTIADCVATEHTIELARIYVDPDIIGVGLGAQLMQAAIEAATTLETKSIWAAVWEKNLRAIDFYKKWGFEKVGERSFMLGNEKQNDWVMEKVL